MYGASGGGAPAPGGDDEEREDRGETGGDGVLSRSVKPGQRVSTPYPLSLSLSEF